jgi:hypothetical protein
MFLCISFYMDNITNPTFRPVFFPRLKKHLVLLPVPGSTLFGLTGNQKVNIGLFVRGILANRSKVGGSYVFCNVADMLVSDYYRLWATIAGKEVQHVQVNAEDFCKMHLGYGQEMTVMLQYWSAYGGKAFSGEPYFGARELGIEDELVGCEAAITGLNCGDF